ncbi:MAG: carbon-nitrogen hydrolase family protein [Parvibaculum sp.]
MSDETGLTRVAAVQMEARVADIPYNLAHAERLIDEAAAKGARIIAIPEFFTTRIVYDERLFACSLPPENPALDLLKAKAARYSAHIGGSYLEMRDGDVYNTYVLVEPDGTVHRHNKDLPTMVENAFYVGGSDDGLIETSLGTIGAAVCWEMIRTQTPKRLRGKVDLLMTGSHWWSGPGWRVTQSLEQDLDAGNRRMMHKTPGFLASLIGAPLLHAGHTGLLEGEFLVLPGTRLTVPTRTELTGETQIIDRTGTLVAHRKAQAGAGVIHADIEVSRSDPRMDIPDRFWTPPKLGIAGLLWHHQNAAGKHAYKWAKRNGRLRTYDFGKNTPA